MVRIYNRTAFQNEVPLNRIGQAVYDGLNSSKVIRLVVAEIKVIPMRLCRSIYIQKAKEDRISSNNKQNCTKKLSPEFYGPQERALKAHLTLAASIYFKLSTKKLRVLAYKCPKRFNITMPRSWECEDVHVQTVFQDS